MQAKEFTSIFSAGSWPKKRARKTQNVPALTAVNANICSPHVGWVVYPWLRPPPAFLFIPGLHRPQEAARVQRQRQVRITFTGSKRQTVIGIEWEEAQRHRKKCKTEAIDCGSRACVAGRRLRETKSNIYVQDTRSRLQQLKRNKEKGKRGSERRKENGVRVEGQTLTSLLLVSLSGR